MPRIIVRQISTRKLPFDYTKFQREFKDEFNNDIRRDMLNEFKKTIEGWKHRPHFYSRLIFSPTKISLFIYAGGKSADQYNLVSLGSPPHPIYAKSSAKRLYYRTGYRAATQPRKISSRAASRYGPMITARMVHHPGFEGREFYETVGDLYVTDYRRRIKNALQRATYRHFINQM